MDSQDLPCHKLLQCLTKRCASCEGIHHLEGIFKGMQMPVSLLAVHAQSALLCLREV